MLALRGFLALAMICLGIYIVAEMVHFPFAQSFTGMVLGVAMILLGVVRLRQVRAAWNR
jgi:putative effector of murein hydrolase LrgA (UPF0299 family)